MKFRNRRLNNYEQYEELQSTIKKQHRDIVNLNTNVDHGLGLDRAETPFVWDPSIASMTYVDDQSVVLCKIIADDKVNSYTQDVYGRPKVFDVKEALGE